jgi:hypothetical protein
VDREVEDPDFNFNTVEDEFLFAAEINHETIGVWSVIVLSLLNACTPSPLCCMLPDMVLSGQFRAKKSMPLSAQF